MYKVSNFAARLALIRKLAARLQRYAKIRMLKFFRSMNLTVVCIDTEDT